ncbi:MAG: flippase-like domain-containing protein [Chloroflexota bacterium]|nr:flippase-like domain-containing protein [Chloroflexota bacterium]
MTRRISFSPRWLPAWTLPALRWAVGVGIVAVLLLRFDVGEVASELRATRLELALPAIAGLVAIHLIGAATWRLLAIRLGDRRLTWAQTLRTYYIAQGLGGLTPGNIGADAYRVYAAPAGIGAWRSTVRPIVVQRVTSSAALAGLGLAALTLLPHSVDVRFVVAASAVLLAIGSSLLAFLLQRPAANGADTRIGQRAPRRALGWAIGAGFVLGLAFHAGAIGLSYLLVASITPIAEPGQVLACLAIARLSILVPISPSGLGLQEGALSFLFLRIGLSPQTAIAAALLNRLALLATVALGGMLLATGSRHSAQELPKTESSSLLPS